MVETASLAPIKSPKWQPETRVDAACLKTRYRLRKSLFVRVADALNNLDSAAVFIVKQAPLFCENLYSLLRKSSRMRHRTQVLLTLRKVT